MDFITRNKFWIGVGAVALVALILFVMGPLAAMGENDEMFSTLEDRAEELDRFARERVKNEKWGEQQQRIQRAMEKQLSQIQEELLSRDALLERHLKDPDTGAAGPLSFVRFGDAYNQKMNELKETLRESVIEVRGDTLLVHRDLGEGMRPQEELHEFEKEVWVQEAIVETIADVNSGAAVVPVFISLQFLGQPERLLAPAHDERFDTIPFELHVAMEFEFFPLFLQRLLEIPLGLEVTSTHLSRYKEGTGGDAREERRGDMTRGRGRGTRRPRDRMRPPEMGEEPYYGPDMPEELRSGAEAEEEEEVEEKEPLPNDLVSVYIQGYVPDYRQPEAEGGVSGAEGDEAGAGGPGVGGGRGRSRFGPNGGPGGRQ
jgi:hypothetical protein